MSEDGRRVAEFEAEVRGLGGKVDELTAAAAQGESAEEALRESEQRYRLLAEHVHDVIWTMDLEGRLTYVSPSIERQRGFKPEEVVGQHLSDHLTPESLAVARRVFAEELAKEGGAGVAADRSRTFELEMRCKDGSTLWTEVTVTGIPDAAGRTGGLVGVSRDVSARKRAEEQLRAAEERAYGDAERRFQALFENAGAGIMIGDVSAHTVVSGNRAICELLGYTAEEIRGLPVAALHPAAQVAAILDLFDRQARGEDRAVTDMPLLRKDGTVLYADLSTAALLSGDRPYLMGIFRDATQRRRDEQEWDKLRAQLVQADKMASVGRLAAGIAHEINNPLAFVVPNLDELRRQVELLLGFVELVGRGASAEERSLYRQRNKIDLVLEAIPEIIGECRDGLARIREVAGELRQFSRLDDGRAEPVQLSELLDSAVALASTELRYRARVVREYAVLPKLLAHGARLGQVFLNILVNAAQAIEEGQAEEQWVRVATGQAHGRLFAEIANSGQPIPPEVLPQIFDPFFTTKPAGQGLGLGLSISYAIVQQHHGTIEVESDPEKGTVFRVWLPLDTGLRASAQRSAEAEPGGPTKVGRILVVDDEPGILSSMRRLLAGHAVVTARSGREALDLLRNDSAFDLVLCDVMMHELSGIELFERVREAHPPMARRFVFMTGGAFTPRVAEFLGQVPNRTLEKPIDLSALTHVVEEAVGSAEVAGAHRAGQP